MTTWMVALLAVLFYQTVCFVVWLLTGGEGEVVAVVATAPLYYAFRGMRRLYRFFRFKYMKKYYALYSFMKRGKNGANQIVTGCMKTSLKAKLYLDDSAEFFVKKRSDGFLWKNLPDKRYIYKGGKSFQNTDMTPWMK